VIAIVASRLDSEARSLAAAWRPEGAAVLSAEDLVSSGWKLRVGDPHGGTAVVSGHPTAVATIRGVLVRRPAVMPEELKQIAREDRAYVAAETNAFLVAWLSALPCPVFNRPSANSLCGPAWDRLHWEVACARHGVAWADGAGTTEVTEVVVCGSDTLFAKTESQTRAAIALSKEANVELLGVRFRGDAVAGVTVAPSLASKPVRDALLHFLAPT
jgi:hypothetical protein